MNNILQSKFATLRLGTPQVFKNLAIIPIFDDAPIPFDYLSMKHALEKELAFITEVSEGGSVPELKVTNKAPLPILLIDGEELIGAKQNRIVNTSILLAPNSETLIPVSCTESGRWSYNSQAFSSSETMMHASSRHSKSERVYASKIRGGAYTAGQSEVWNDVANLHGSLGTQSSSGAMSEAFAQKKQDLTVYENAFPLLDNQKGMIALINGTVQAADFISKSEAYGDLHTKLVKSFAVECLAMHAPEKEVDATNLNIEAWQWLNGLSSAQEDVFEPIGLGTDLRLKSDTQGAAALIYQDTLVHLSAYTKVPSVGNTTTNAPSSHILGDSLRRPRYFSGSPERNRDRGSMGGNVPQ